MKACFRATRLIYPAASSSALHLGKVLLTAPDVLFLDEPTKGMDGEFKRRFGELLSRLKAEGKTIFLVSHDIEFCAQCADCCALLFRGEIVRRSAPRKFFSGNFFLHYGGCQAQPWSD